MSEGQTVLVVDDEESIRTMLSMVLKSEGFAVTMAGTVPEALALIAQSSFDVLISDLNIGHPADGFVVVSAMRRTHPSALTFILTGYPAFESALEALRHHVNEYLLKGTPIEELVAKVKAGLAAGKSGAEPQKSKRVAKVIEINKDWVIEEWLRRVDAHGELRKVKLSEQERKDHVPSLLDEAIAHARGEAIGEQRQEAAREHGTLRYRQGYTAPMLVAEARLLQNVIADCVRGNFLLVDLSNLVADIAKIADTVTMELERSVRAFVGAQGNGA
jgi:DNA-binding response OmpR family regulator